MRRQALSGFLLPIRHAETSFSLNRHAHICTRSIEYIELKRLTTDRTWNCGNQLTLRREYLVLRTSVPHLIIVNTPSALELGG